MATKKLKPVNEVKEISTADIDPTAQKLDIMIQYLERLDWKLWMIMGMVRMIGEENGYKFSFYDNPDSLNDTMKEAFERSNEK